uniref:SCP domain-containing protein n=1 Tax=Panagrolaimus sp. PS1159 TaxID=55785 RepID=A0AC35G1Z9_9BILA
MYKLKYSCKLEAMAQEWANQKIFQYNENQKVIPGENIYLKWSQKDNLEDDAINETSISWWNELSQNGLISEKNVTFTKEMHSIGHWSQMAWSSTEFIGCGFKKFKKQNEPDRFLYYTVCNYFPAGNILGMKIYEIGNPCKKDSECSEKPKSICDVDTGLCYAN